ncbi:MAG: choice-of-anchor J domain-containing protein [Bacteroidales bacterium]|nr:choice-of-anchor J domain-containing protein [Bacteroidales bacterium]
MIKNLHSIFSALAITLLLVFATNALHAQTLLYYWNFNDNVPATDENWTQPIMSQIGDAEISYTFTEAYSFSGTTINGIEGEVNGGSFAPRGGVDVVNNGAYFTITAPTTGYQDIILTYPTRRTSTGFHTQEIQYTIDGTNWLPKESIDISLFVSNWVEGQVINVNFSGVAGVDDNPDFAIRVILTGAGTSAGNNRIDNIKVTGSQPGAVSPPANFSAATVSVSQIDLNWVLNSNNNPVLIAWSADGVFGNPSGSYDIDDPITGGGTVIYMGAATSFSHEDLSAGTPYYYKAWSQQGSDYSAGVTAQATTTPLPAVTALPYNEVFEADLGDSYVYSVSGPTKLWNFAIYEDNGYAQINGFNSGDVEEDWLILPGVNFDDYENEVMTFDTWWRYGEDDDNNYLKLFYSTDYPGTGNPATSTWTELAFTKPTAEDTWASSGQIDLTGITGEMVYIGFKYRYEAGKYKWWQVDDISVLGDPTGIDDGPAASLLQIGPNPTSGRVTLMLPETNQKILVYNITGNVVLETTNLEKSFELNMGSHSKGIYIIKVISADGVRSSHSKLIVQ